MASSAPIPSRFLAALLLLVVAFTQSALAFAPPSNHIFPQCSSRSRRTSSSSKVGLTFTKTKRVYNQQTSIPTLLSATTSSNDIVQITFPTPEEAASMGIRDWPQQFHNQNWDEKVSEGQIATRYVLSGNGRVTIDYYDDVNLERQRVDKQRVYPGTLIEVDGEANLFWEVDDGREGMIVLTPSYEEGGKLLLVAGALVIFCAGLIAGSTGM